MEQLCRAINMPEPVTEILLQLDAALGDIPGLEDLRREESWDAARELLKQQLGEDPDGMKELCCQLRCALLARRDYEALNFSEEIYFASMGALSRFVREHMESYGTWGFDRGFWSVRQIAARLFRLGQLEYELTDWQGRKAVSIHIPTDAVFTPEQVQESLDLADALLTDRFPDYAAGPWFCHSWLLSPVLQDMLPGSSNILHFQRRFAVRKLDRPCEGMLQWVYKNPDLTPEALPENTSLQKKIKAYLLAGNTFWDAAGILER